MDHEFDLAFELLDNAVDRLQLQQYGITTIEHQNHGEDLLLTSRHTYSSGAGHKLTLLATYKDSGQTAAAVEVTSADLDTDPQPRIVKVQAGDLMFHAIPGTWSFRATGHRTYIITAGVGDEPIWTLTAGGVRAASDSIAELVDQILAAEAT
ncbi:hypothetical protein [Mycobacterium arosiense]|uniref:Uncharacterized protein n=1 Tax=Mycobacterium arosiense ATCC BAA-1401 = DSM 45069 TaxID=1265311 RepID=A0A1W9ZH03_MYCAI|nr:hypothetical protein [Mycobacterium arosiense]ORA14860.1 hypothetical protein BST14_13295 [Mycobacterium arosiense ATCC BAA-1401 = DSM 45069]